MSAPFPLPYRTAPDTLDAIRADLDHMLGRVDAFAAETHRPDEAEAVEVLAREGRALYLRRALEQAAEHAAAMLPALGLPTLVVVGVLQSEETPFAPCDRGAILDSLDAAIVALDALDDDPEAEPWLGWTGAAIGRAEMGGTLDREAEPEHDEDDGTGEPSLASPERHPWVPAVSWGLYTARGGEEGQLRWAEGGHHDRELDLCDGPIDEDELDDDGLSHAEGDSADDEPNLGAPAGDGNQGRWAQGPSHSNDPEADDADAEEDDPVDDDRTAEDSALRVWVFGPSRREGAHA